MRHVLRRLLWILLLWWILRGLLICPCLRIGGSASCGSHSLTTAIAEAHARSIGRATIIAERLAVGSRHRCCYLGTLSAVRAESAAGWNLLMAGGTEVWSWLRDDSHGGRGGGHRLCAQRFAAVHTESRAGFHASPAGRAGRGGRFYRRLCLYRSAALWTEFLSGNIETALCTGCHRFILLLKTGDSVDRVR